MIIISKLITSSLVARNDLHSLTSYNSKNLQHLRTNWPSSHRIMTKIDHPHPLSTAQSAKCEIANCDPQFKKKSSTRVSYLPVSLTLHALQSKQLSTCLRVIEFLKKYQRRFERRTARAAPPSINLIGPTLVTILLT